MRVFVCMRVCEYAHGGITIGVFVCMRVCLYAHGGKTMGVFVYMCMRTEATRWVCLCVCVYGVCAFVCTGFVCKGKFSKNAALQKLPQESIVDCPRGNFWPRGPRGRFRESAC